MKLLSDRNNISNRIQLRLPLTASKLKLRYEAPNRIDSNSNITNKVFSLILKKVS